MKNLFACIVIASVMTLAVYAETSTKISEVHLCCPSCVKGVEKAVADFQGVTATVDKDAGTVPLTGPEKSTVQKAAHALFAASYFEKSRATGIKILNDPGAKGKKVQTLKLE